MSNNRVDQQQEATSGQLTSTKFNGCSSKPKNDNEKEKESICCEKRARRRSSLSQVVNQDQIERLDEENERVKKTIGDKQGQSLGKNFRKKKQRIRNSAWIVIFSRLPMFKTWLTFFQILLIQSAQLLEIKCDQLTGNDLISPGQSVNSIDVIQDIEDQLQAQLKQQRSFDYMIQQQQQQQEPDNKSNPEQRQQQQQQEQQQKEQNQQSQEQQEQLSFNQVINNLRDTIGDENWVRDIAGNQDEKQALSSHSQQLSIEDLLEPQSSASSAANTSPSDSAKQPPKSTQETQQTSTGSSNEAKPTPASSSTNSAASPSSNLLSDQLNAVSNLLQQLSQQGQNTFSAALQSSLIDQNALSDAIINGVSNSILGPIRSQTSAVSNIVRKTMNSNRNQAQQQQSASSGDMQIVSATGSNKPTVGQSIDGNIEYDSNNNAINGFIEFPSIPGLGNGSKPSLSSIRPLFVTALKTFPIKLGTVGWKLLQLIAWKKIYKTHHPKSGEIVIEQEMGHSKDKKSTGGKSFEIEMPPKHIKTSKMGKSYQYSSGGHSKGGGGSTGGGGHMMMMTPVTMGHMVPSSWHYGPMDGSPHMSGSMVYQRHLLPPYHSHGGQIGPNSASTNSNSNNNHQSNAGVATNSHPATAAAAAAAATAAAIQSQWVQQQLVAANDEIGATAAAIAGTEAVSSQITQPVASNGGATSNGRNQTAPHAPQANALSRKRSSLAATGNWFATPAHAYAAAAAAAAANAAATAAAASQHHHHHHNPLYRFGLNPAFGPSINNNNNNNNNNPMLDPATSAHSHDNGFNHALATNLLYQNLFDNAAAMAVQNTVKLPPTNSLQMDYLDQSDSLSGSSLSLAGSAGMSPTTSDSEVAWSTGLSGEAPGLSASVAQRSGLLAPSSMDISSSSSAADAAAATAAADLINGLGNDGLMALTHDPDHPNTATNALMSVPDFDDAPTSKYIGAALNETGATYSDLSPLSPRFDEHKS